MNGTGTRTPFQIGVSRGLETGLLGLGAAVIAAVVPLAISDLAKGGLHQLAADWQVYAVAAAIVILTALGNWATAYQSALKNQTVTGTTAPVTTVAAPVTTTASGGETIVAPKGPTP